MSKKDGAKRATRKSSTRDDDDQPPGRSTRKNDGKDTPELLPSDMNDSTDVSPRVAFLAYN